ncbi:hypothetical protein [Campylobacter sp. RM15925]|uniref:hypothetical protein n=1 Tax=Campylobacter sp. RM15925 TaxID=1705724 RepID=UPI001472959E|nr:hypothetical protein [Campylobacter sp. RM15925]
MDVHIIKCIIKTANPVVTLASKAVLIMAAMDIITVITTINIKFECAKSTQISL